MTRPHEPHERATHRVLSCASQFNSLEPDVCHLLFVKDVELTAVPAAPPTGQTARGSACAHTPLGACR